MTLRLMNRLRATGRFNISITSSVSIVPTTLSTVNHGNEITLSNNDLTATITGLNSGLSDVGVSSGKYYWECTLDSGLHIQVGISILNILFGTHLRGSSGTIAYLSNGNVGDIDGSFTYGDPINTGDIVSIALDMNTGKLWFGLNGVWQAGGDPATDTNSVQDVVPQIPLATDLGESTIYAAYADGSTSNNLVLTFNFGQNPFAHTVPNGFLAGFGALA